MFSSHGVGCKLGASVSVSAHNFPAATTAMAVCIPGAICIPMLFQLGVCPQVSSTQMW